MAITRVIHALGDILALGSAALARQMPGGALVVVPAQGAGNPASLVLTESGALVLKAAPSAGDRRLFLSADGLYVASTSQPSASKPVRLVGGRRLAG